MKRSPLILIAAAVGMGLGFAGGRGISSPASASVPPMETSQVRASERQRSPSAAEPRSLSKLIRLAGNHKRLGDPVLQREIERLGTDALRALITDCLTDPPWGMAPGADAARALVTAATKELYHREGENAFLAADQLENPEIRRMFLWQLLEVSAAEEPRAALKWAERMSKEFGEGPMRTAALAAIPAALDRSADDYLDVIGLFPTMVRAVSVGVGNSFAENFDFQKALEGSGADSLAAAWAARDPDAAWDTAKRWIEEKGWPATNYFGQVFSGVAMAEGNETAAGWLAEKIREVPEQHRLDAFQSLQAAGFVPPEQVTAILAALNEPAQKVQFASTWLDHASNQSRGVAALEALPPNLRIEALVAAAGRQAPMMRSNGPADVKERIRAHLDSPMDQTNLPPEARASVHASLDSD